MKERLLILKYKGHQRAMSVACGTAIMVFKAETEAHGLLGLSIAIIIVVSACQCHMNSCTLRIQ